MRCRASDPNPNPNPNPNPDPDPNPNPLRVTVSAGGGVHGSGGECDAGGQTLGSWVRVGGAGQPGLAACLRPSDRGVVRRGEEIKERGLGVRVRVRVRGGGRRRA